LGSNGTIRGLRRPSGEVQQPPRPLVDQLDDPPEDGRIPTRIDQLLARVSRRAGRVPRRPAQAAAGRGGTEPGLVEQAVAVPRVPHDTALDLAELSRIFRKYGRDRILIIAVVDQLQRDDPTYQREFKQLCGTGLRALARGELASAAPTAEFGLED
jgi:hypothetical protein